MKTIFFVLLLLCLLVARSWAQKELNPLKSLPSEGLTLQEGWRFQSGDNPAWANTSLPDQSWPIIQLTRDINDPSPLNSTRMGWLRWRFSIDSSWLREPLALVIQQAGASEIYLNGQLLHRWGVVSADPKKVIAFDPLWKPIPLPLRKTGEQVLAVRFAHQPGIHYTTVFEHQNPPIWIQVKKQALADTFYQQWLVVTERLHVFLISACGLLAILHLAFYRFDPSRKANLYFGMWAVLLLTGNVLQRNLMVAIHEVADQFYVANLAFDLYGIGGLLLLLALYQLLEQPKDNYYWGLLVWICIGLLLNAGIYGWGWKVGGVLAGIASQLNIARIAWLAIRRHQPGAWIIGLGAISYALFFLAFFLPALWRDEPFSVDIANRRNVLYILSLLSIPVATSIYLGLEFALLSRALAQQLIEVKSLSHQALIQEQQTQALQELDTLKSRFFANLSHEFRTPLSLIKGAVEKLEQQDEPGSRRWSDYQLIGRSAGRLLQLINQLLDLSRLEAGKLALHPQPGELTRFLQGLAGSFASLFESKGITYHYTVSLQPVWVQMDSDKLEQIISNLLSNACKFTPAKGQVRFSASVTPSQTGRYELQLIVEDTGIGIADDQLPRIFDRFYQVDDSATRSYEGTGIGLALVKELVDLHGGNIQAESRLGSGTTFHLRLPLKTARVGELPGQESPGQESAALEIPLSEPMLMAPSTMEEGAQASKRQGNSGHLLIVEDNQDLRQFLVSHLSNTYDVSEAENGLEGYQMALELIPDLMIADVMMPGLDGISLCEKLKTDERTSHIPIILLTAKADTESKQQGLETGADDYLSKPVGLRELQVRVRNLLEGRKKLRERFSRQITLQPREVVVTSLDEQFLQKVLAVTEANLANAAFDVDLFSQEMGLSRTQLHRKLTALTEQSPNEFIRAIRLSRAASLLSQQGGNVAEVAYQVGFSSPNYFTKCFRDVYGQTPTEYASGRVASLKKP
ncbi:hybrid sensor histidine kinase/response regulator transcription factor [Spirosoma endbachense]|uniref:histidine kinase n=1 Tax=Spirosoma endbachense TaxID=2666025 RepID=A0A6P1W367_9BACT|nr:ATP-binding protein [Spirosoma endbachense]QHV99334.1 response regulator [Spirosoma endbachense]